MKIVFCTADATKEEVLSWLTNPGRTNAGVRFDEGKRGTPTMLVASKNDRVSVRCRYVGGTTRDNGYLMGTWFSGRLREKNGKTHISGIIVTEPILHLLWLGLIVFFLVTCLQRGGFSVVPLCLAAIAVFLFLGEYRKQGIIKRYVIRAARRAGDERPRG